MKTYIIKPGGKWLESTSQAQLALLRKKNFNALIRSRFATFCGKHVKHV